MVGDNTLHLLSLTYWENGYNWWVIRVTDTPIVSIILDIVNIYKTTLTDILSCLEDSQDKIEIV